MLPVTTPGAEIVFEGTCNFRELGGYRAADGRHVRRGLLYRGCSLDTLQSPADRTKLESLHLREILDLRSAGEAACQPDAAVSGAHYQRICGMRYADGSEMDFSPAGIQRIAAQPVHRFCGECHQSAGSDDTPGLHKYLLAPARFLHIVNLCIHIKHLSARCSGRLLF